MYRVPFREAVLRVYEYTGSLRKASRICGVSIASISRWSRQLEPCKRAKRRPFLSDAIVSSVDAFMRSKTRCSSVEVVAYVQDTWGINISRQLAHCIIRRLGFTFKRSRKRGKRKDPQEDNAVKRFFEQFNNACLQGTPLHLLTRVGLTSGQFPSMGMLHPDHLQSSSMTDV